MLMQTVRTPRAVVSALLALGLLSGCGLGSGSGSSSPSGHASHSPTGHASDGPSSFSPTQADFRAIKALLAKRAKAAMTRDKAAYLATVDDTNHAFVGQQTILYGNLSRLAIAHLSYGVDTSSMLQPAAVPGNDPVIRPGVIEHLQLKATLDRPVGNQVELTFVRRHGRWLVGAEMQPTDEGHYDSPQERPWFGSPVAVRRLGAMTVMVDDSDRSGLAALTSAIAGDIRFDARLLRVPASQQILVDATSNGATHKFNATSQETAAAVTFGLYATDPLGEHITGRAGSAIKINPQEVDQFAHDTSILRHELTHFLLRAYSGATPTWLSEGVATWVQYYPDDFTRLQLPASLYDRLQRQEHRLPIVGLFKDDPSANYLIAQAAVTWLVQHYGVSKLIALMRAYLKAYAGPDVDALTPRLLRQTYGISEATLVAGTWQLLAQFQH